MRVFGFDMLRLGVCVIDLAAVTGLLWERVVLLFDLYMYMVHIWGDVRLCMFTETCNCSCTEVPCRLQGGRLYFFLHNLLTRLFVACLTVYSLRPEIDIET